MGERTRVVMMSRAQAHYCRLSSASLCKSTEVDGTGGRVPVILCGAGCFWAPPSCKGWSRARFHSRVPRSPLCFRLLTGASWWLARWCERRSGNSADGGLTGGDGGALVL